MSDIATKSVKRYDAVPADAAYVLVLPTLGGEGLLPRGLPAELPRDWQRRDRVLRAATRHEGMWHAAVAIKIDKTIALGYRIDVEDPAMTRRLAQARAVLKALPFAPILRKLLRDYWTTNNGYMLEVIRASSARGSRVLAIDHLDSNHCVRTGDPERPIVYQDRGGRPRVLRAHQVVFGSHMERSERDANGLGECAADGAYRFILELAAINAFVFERVAGRKPLVVYLVAGPGASNIQAGIEAAKQTPVALDADGAPPAAQHHMGAAIVPIPQADNLRLITIPLSELPNGFDETSRWDKCLLAYAKNLELDPQDLQPIRAGIGTATQSTLLHTKAGQQDSFVRTFCTTLADCGVIPAGTTFYMQTNDPEQQRARAELSQLRTDDYVAMQQAGWITADQGRQLKVDDGDLPAAVLPAADVTPELSVEDTDNPGASEGGE